VQPGGWGLEHIEALKGRNKLSRSFGAAAIYGMLPAGCTGGYSYWALSEPIEP